MIKYMLALAIAFPLLAVAQQETFQVETKLSNVHWLGKKTTGQHEGDVKLKDGHITMNDGKPTGGEFVLDMNSITVTDIKDPEDNKSLVDHLKDEDFFDTAKYPTATLSVKQAEAIKGAKAEAPNYNVTADLLIKGTKSEIQFPARIDVRGNSMEATAEITIDRTKWHIVYKSKTLLGSTADKFIYDDVKFSVVLALSKAK